MKCPKDVLVEIMVSDPWEWGTELGVGPFTATIVEWELHDDGQAKAILLVFANTVEFEGVECRYFVGSPRFVGAHLEDIMQGKKVECCLTRIPEDRFRSPDPFDLSWWRGGVGLTCTIRRKK